MRFVIDPGTAIRIASGELVPDPAHKLLAPVLLRSEVLDILYGRARRGEMPEPQALDLNAAFGRLKIRYLGDAVLRRRAWAVADRLGLEHTALAEYVALTQLQADALIAADPALADAAEGLVQVHEPDAMKT